MTCQDIDSRLDQLLDGELEAVDAAAIHAHLAACGSCRAELACIQTLSDAARDLPPSLEPPHDLWPGIVAGLRPRRQAHGWPGWLGAAAAVVMVAAVVTGMLAGPGQAPDRARGAASALANGSARAALGSSEHDFQTARTTLLAALEQRRGSLSEGTVRLVFDGVRVIDGAIAAIGGALEEHPGDAGLARRLASAYRQEIDLLQRATRLPNET